MEGQEYLSYTLHDIVKEYLQSNVTPDEQKRYHLQLVQSYSHKCAGIFSDLEEDGYIHQWLLMHVNEAGNMELLSQLLTDLLWVAACCKYWHASSLLDSYQSYEHTQVR